MMMLFKMNPWARKMVKLENPEHTLFHRHAEATTTCIATNSENNLKTGSTDYPQLLVQKRSH